MERLGEGRSSLLDVRGVTKEKAGWGSLEGEGEWLRV